MTSVSPSTGHFIWQLLLTFEIGTGLSGSSHFAAFLAWLSPVMVSGKPAGRCFLKRVNHSFTPVNHSARMEGRMFRLTLMAVLFASQAFAGAWPREKGSVFAMTSYQVSAPDLSGPVSSYY